MVRVSDVRFDPWDLEDARQEALLAAYEAGIRGLDPKIAARRAAGLYLRRACKTKRREFPIGLLRWSA